MPFEKGESGNPAGRPRGSRNRATLLMESLLADDAEAIGRKAIEMAKQGDMAAIRLCMDRLAAGELTPSEGADLAKVVDVYVRAIATTAFDERLTKLEATTPR